MPSYSDESERTQALPQYNVGDVIENRYKILTPAINVLGGRFYKASPCEKPEQKDILLMQFLPWVNTASYHNEEMEMESLPQKGLLVASIPGLLFLDEVLGSLSEAEIAEVFNPILTWLQDLHENKGRTFPFLHYHNILVRPNRSIVVLGQEFQYDYTKCDYNPYAHLIPPSYLNYLHFPTSKYHAWSDYYPVAIMVWRAILGREPHWDAPALRFKEKVRAQIYTDFISSFVEGTYPRGENPIARFRNPKIVPEETPQEVVYTEIPPIENAEEQEMIERLQEENATLKLEKSQLKKEKETIQDEKDNLLHSLRKRNTHLWLTVFGFLFSFLGILAILYFLGFRIASPDTMEKQQIAQVQKIVWHTFALLQASQIPQAESLYSPLKDDNAKMVYCYLHALAQIHALSLEENRDKQTELRRQIVDSLKTIQNSSDRFVKEIQKYELPFPGIEQIQNLLQVYQK